MIIPIYHLNGVAIIADVDIGEIDAAENDGVRLGIALQTFALTGRTLVNANLSGIECQHACLKGIRLFGCELKDANFSNADLDEASFTGAKLTNARFDNASLCDACFSSSSIMETSFDKADLTRAAFLKANLKDVSFKETLLEAASFDGALCERVDFEAARINDTTWSATELLDTALHTAYWGTSKLKAPPIQIDGLTFKTTLVDSQISIGGKLYAIDWLRNLTMRKAIAFGGLNGVRFMAALKTLRAASPHLKAFGEGQTRD